MGQKCLIVFLFLTVLVIKARTGVTTKSATTEDEKSEGRLADYPEIPPGGLKSHRRPVASEPVDSTFNATRTHIHRVDDGSHKAGCHSGADADYEQFVYNPHIIINPPKFSTALVDTACCNSSKFREIVSSEMARLGESYLRLREDTTRQLEKLQTTVSDLAGMLTKLLEPTSNPSQLLTTTGVKTTKPETTTLPTTATARTEPIKTTTTTTTATTTTTTTRSFVTIQKDCSEAPARGVRSSGMYIVQPVDNGENIKVYCDMETDGGGWTVFQRRQDGTVDFYRDFESYRQGFGIPDGEFWLGNDNLHRLTAQDEYKLRIDLTDFEDNYVYAEYDSFHVGDKSDNYRLTVGTYSGTAGDSLSTHNNRAFSTKDRDNDEYSSGNCAQQFHGAWWYERCHQSNLNGIYLGGATNAYARGVVWRRWRGYRYSMRSSEMKFRKKI